MSLSFLFASLTNMALAFDLCEPAEQSTGLFGENRAPDLDIPEDILRPSCE